MNENNFIELPERKLNHSYIELLTAYNAGILEAAVTALGAVHHQMGRLRPAAMPNPSGLQGNKPMVRISRAMAAIEALTGDIESLRAECRDIASISDNPLNPKGKSHE